VSSTEEESVRMSIEGLDLILFGKKLNERNSPHLFPCAALPHSYTILVEHRSTRQKACKLNEDEASLNSSKIEDPQTRPNIVIGKGTITGLALPHSHTSPHPFSLGRPQQTHQGVHWR